jgi:ADP-heptose:LPS heptosyltransferase
MNSTFKYDIVPYTRGVGLEISPGSEKMFPHFIKWDEEALKLIRPCSMDFIVFYGTDITLRVLEVVKQNGYIIIITKKSDEIESSLKQYLSISTVEILYSDVLYLYVLQKTSKATNNLPRKSDKTCAVLRYGGIGDMMITSCIFPELKKQGYHVTLYTHTNSYEVVKHDPHIDRFILQDSGQVPINEFRDFCMHTKSKYDKFINLSESIEGTLLSLPDRVSYYWPKEIRHELMSKSCYDITAKISEVPKNLCGKFYYTDNELIKVKKLISKLDGPIILWVLSGSSVHKFWPYQDQAIARILIQYPTSTILLVGDISSKLLEQGWEKESRVKCLSGELSVRETMTLCYIVDLIVTPETGIALSVQFEDIPKILLLSHSSKSNYSDEWINCIAIEPDNCECYPCHKLHYGFEYCSIVELTDKSGESAKISECQYQLSIDKVTNSINSVLERNFINVQRS